MSTTQTQTPNRHGASRRSARRICTMFALAAALVTAATPTASSALPIGGGGNQGGGGQGSPPTHPPSGPTRPSPTATGRSS